MKKTVVYVMGLGHSGSTTLQYLLCRNLPAALGLGEVFKLSPFWAAESRHGECACGNDVQNCALWGQLEPLSKESNEHWYWRLQQHLFVQFPDSGIWIDTSKSLKEFKAWKKMTRDISSLELKIIFLARDVQSWAWSDERVRTRKNRPTRGLWVSMVFWSIQQLRFLLTIKKSKLPYHLILYDSLAKETSREIRQVREFLQVNTSDHVDDRIFSHAVHDVTGNRMKKKIGAESLVRYDDAWLSDLRITKVYKKNWLARIVMAQLRKIEKQRGQDYIG